MKNYDESAVMSRIENMANKVYRGNKNAVYMLINDMEELFEMNSAGNHVERMTTEEFDRYIENIRN